jgi:hypothetical protein
MRWVPSVVISACIMIGAACGPPLPPFRGPIPVPIPSVTPTFVCTHWLLPGARYTLTVPQKGVWSFDWQDSLTQWHTAIPFWHEAGDTLTIETPFAFRVTWSPSATPGTTWHIVSAVTPLQVGSNCPDF